MGVQQWANMFYETQVHPNPFQEVTNTLSK